ncbi:tRNA(Ile)-lysidine synthase [Alteribacillus persepolensis]|uniref:tRNA(Ile)-lysidine synthase n=1 Tax=Alteribacillus persepolensis TaxID=568899 RepID=A0A1G8I1C0_9BACI|nr:tRNA lysidine(34) synthetase TilS [Alteribacillus persepolensis]SDI12551.1 tRNA(Ile)-lysidine synthase [Alteribacillus persepolensis]
MKQIVEQWIQDRGLMQEEQKVLAAVSGGPDSMALLHILLELQNEGKVKVMAAHVNHGLREETAQKDESFVHTWCEEHGVPCFSRSVSVREAMKEEGGGVQEQARRLRYAYFKEIMSKHNIGILATGHHADDQVETMLMKQVSGRSVLGDAGIAASRPFGSGRLIRPLLPVTKEDIYAYCREHNISFRVDESNTSDKYARNRFRKQVLPFLKQENNLVHQHFQEYFDWQREERAYIEHEAEKNLKHVIIAENDDFLTISREAWLALPLPLQRRSIHLILKYLCLGNVREISTLHIKQLIHLLNKTHPSFSLDWPGGVKVSRSYNHVTFTVKSRSRGKTDITDEHIVLSLGQEITYQRAVFLAERMQFASDMTSCADKLVLREDKDLFPLTVRPRISGDKIQLLGMNGTKKVNRIFIDEKIPRDQRDQWPVVTDAKGEVLWIPYLRKSARHVQHPEPHAHYILLTCKGNMGGSLKKYV